MVSFSQLKSVYFLFSNEAQTQGEDPSSLLQGTIYNNNVISQKVITLFK